MAINVVPSPDKQPAPAALRLVPAGRLAATPDTWRAPLPPSLQSRVDKQRGDEHARLVARYELAAVEITELAARLEQQRVDDEHAFRKAIAAGRRAPAGKAPAIEQELEQARATLDAVAELVAESGRSIASELTDDDLREAVDAATARGHAVLETVPGKLREAAAALDELAGATYEARWVATLLERRRQQPWRPGATRPSRIGAAHEGLVRALEQVEAELTELAHRATPVQHNPPRGLQIEPGHRFTTTPLAVSGSGEP